MKAQPLDVKSSPPYAVPLRWFALAPPMLALTGLLLLFEGPTAVLSRWTPAALALTHLTALGFMGSVMLGALVQVLPVLAGAVWPPMMFRWHLLPAAWGTGVLLLAASFLWPNPALTGTAAMLLTGTLAVFLSIAFLALASARNPAGGDLRRALTGFALTALLGLGLLAQREGIWLADHFAWVSWHVASAWSVWGLGLVAAIAYAVVPMFQLTPPYPERFRARWGKALWLLPLAVGAGVAFGNEVATGTAVLGALLLVPPFAVQTLQLQARSKRPRHDATWKLWRMAMASTLAAPLAALLAAGDVLSPWWVGVTVFWGGFAAVICGMWVKILPFLTWLHLQQRPGRQGFPPTMLRITPEAQADRLWRMHALAAALLLAGLIFPEPFMRLAGLAVIACAAQLGYILWLAVRTYRRWPQTTQAQVEAPPSTTSPG